MKAVVITSYGRVEGIDVQKVDIPPAPTADRVRVRVHAAGLNRADILQRRGHYPAPPGYSTNIPGLVDDEATVRLRTAMRAARIGTIPSEPATGRRGRPLSATLDLVDDSGTIVVACARCANLICRADAPHLRIPDPRRQSRLMNAARLGSATQGLSGCLRRFYCPKCAVQLDVQVCRASDPVLSAVEVLN